MDGETLKLIGIDKATGNQTGQRRFAMVEVVDPERHLKFSWRSACRLMDFPEYRAGKFEAKPLPRAGDVAICGLDSLSDQLPEDLRRLIERGDDEAQPVDSQQPRFHDAGELVWKVAADLALLNYQPVQIAGLLLNPELALSRSILARRHPEKFALRLVGEATLAVSSSWPDQLKDGTPKATLRNALSALTRLGVDCTHDQFRDRKRFRLAGPDGIDSELSEDGCARLRKLVLDRLGFDAGKMQIMDAANILCLDNAYHPLLDYLI